jgi:hypothetical protein
MSSVKLGYHNLLFYEQYIGPNVNCVRGKNFVTHPRYSVCRINLIHIHHYKK